jgi:radical SAM protein with 4Fe4S-binding SPASM domain
MNHRDPAELAVGTGLRPPRSLTVAITGECNLRCRHCFVKAGLPTAAGDAPVEEVLRLADEFAALGGETLCITGGEPLSHPEWRTILSHCCSLPSLRTVRVQTNAGLLDDARLAELRSLPPDKLAFQVSLDGASQQTHDRIRGKGSFGKTTAGIKRLVAAGLGGRVSLAFTEMRHNMEDVPELLELVDRLGLRGAVGGTLVKHGNAAKADLEPPTPDQYRALLARYHADARFRDLYDRHGRFSAVEWWKGRSRVRGDPCSFLDHPYVTAEGKIYPCLLCHADEFAAGSAFEKPLAVALGEGAPRWSELVQISRQRSEDLSECEDCPARPSCAGGCMGRAHSATGCLTAVEDRCELRRAIHSWREEEEDGGLLAPPRVVGL